MRWRDAIGLASRSVGRRPGRAVLTVLAVALAAALFSALLTIARTAETRVLDELAKGGPLSGIRVAPAAPNPAEADKDDTKGSGELELTDESLQAMRALPDVRDVIPIVGTPVVFSMPGTVELPSGQRTTTRPSERSPAGTQLATAVGVDIRKIEQLPVTVMAGRVPAPGARDEVALTPGFLARLGLDEDDAAEVVGLQMHLGVVRHQTMPAPRQRPIEDLDIEHLQERISRVRIGGGLPFEHSPRVATQQRWLPVEVVGVVAQEAASGDALVPLELALDAHRWIELGERTDGGFGPRSPYRGAFVVASGIDQVGAVRDAIADVGYSSSAPENLIASVRRYLHVVEIVLGGIATIALLIASLGICNAMLSAIRERRREIGVLKAIGARDRDVRRVFLIEAAVLGLLGGVAGTGLGLTFAAGVGEVVNRYLTSEGLAGVDPSFSAALVAVAIAGSLLLATGAGVVPAARAARLPAREAVDA